jgi:hypothetical protein
VILILKITEDIFVGFSPIFIFEIILQDAIVMMSKRNETYSMKANYPEVINSLKT